jgi:hypothetical protein
MSLVDYDTFLLIKQLVRKTCRHRVAMATCCASPFPASTILMSRSV